MKLELYWNVEAAVVGRIMINLITWLIKFLNLVPMFPHQVNWEPQHSSPGFALSVMTCSVTLAWAPGHRWIERLDLQPVNIKELKADQMSTPSSFSCKTLQLGGLSMFTRVEAWVIKWGRGTELNTGFLALQLSYRVRGEPQPPPVLFYANLRVIALVLF